MELTGITQVLFFCILLKYFYVSGQREEISVLVDPNDIEGYHKRRKTKEERLEAIKQARQNR